MAICRVSDYQCDLYIYESAEGIMCHVASKRMVGEPEPPILSEFEFDMNQWTVAYDAYRQALTVCKLVPIGLSHDGAFEAFADYGELLEFVRMLREEGYLVPDWVTAGIATEAALGEGL